MITPSTDRPRTRRSVLKRVGGTVAATASVALAGCSSVLPGADYASYWSDSRQLDIEYDSVLSAAQDANYTVEEPFYVSVRDPRGVHPEELADFDQRFGPDYRVFGFTFFPADYVFVEFGLTADTPTVTLIDDRSFDEFPVASMPSEAWLVDRFTLAFDMSESTARDHVSTLRERVAEGASTPSVEIDAPVTFPDVYAHIEAERTETTGSETGGDGWYTETSFRDEQRYATVDIIVPSMEVRHTDGDRTYTLKLDRLGGLYLRIRLPVGDEIPESEYRGTFRDMFEDIGLPTDVVDELTFEYSPSVW